MNLSELMQQREQQRNENYELFMQLDEANKMFRDQNS
jgi:hypothetical protein